MKPIFTILLFFLIQNLVAQPMETKDSLVIEICRSVNQLEDLNDSLTVWNTVNEHLTPYFSKMSPETQQEAWMFISMRLQRNCKRFSDFIRSNYPAKAGGWKVISKMPTIKATKNICRAIVNTPNLYYLETTGDTVKLDLSKNHWTDHFKDGTYSKLGLRWLTECEFEITFIESNNITRRNFSKPGDKYRYTIIEKKENYYIVVVEAVGSGRNDLVMFNIQF